MMCCKKCGVELSGDSGYCGICGLKVTDAELSGYAEAKRLRIERFYDRGKAIVEVKLLDGGSTDYKRGGLGGALVGGFFGGPVGAVIGAALPKGSGEQRQKFAVRYSSGKVVIKEHHPNSWEYKELMKYVRWSEI